MAAERRRVPHDRGQYLNRADLEGFEKYAYHGVDTSPLAIYVMKPFWNFCVNVLTPIWLAPNLMTFIGFLLILSNVLILWVYDPDFRACSGSSFGDIPSWVFFYCAFAQFVGHQLDGMDGTQARRTRTSSPIGELFDHGLDSMGCFLQPLASISCLGMCGVINEDNSFFVLWAIMISFFLTHFEKYNTGVLFLPWTYDLSQLLVAAVFLLTGFYGIEMWNIPFSLVTFEVTAGYIVFLASVLSAVFSLLLCLYHIVHAHSCQKRGCILHTLPPPKWPLLTAVAPLLVLVALIAVSAIWKFLSPANIAATHLRVFMLLFGVLFSNITCRLIMCQMSSRPYRLLQLLPAPLLLIVPLALSGFANEEFLLYSYFIVATAAHIHYGVGVVQELCEFWHIACFTIPY
eukprot:m.7045 g.7045  ORF g.7045 m.7045 type:complete len:402 (-) comp4937_c1_seq1:39-1244(-)